MKARQDKPLKLEDNESVFQTIKPVYHQKYVFVPDWLYDAYKKEINCDDAHMEEANEKEMNSKRIYLKAREIISCVDFEYKKSLENHARSMSQMDKIRHEADLFTKQLINK